MDTNLDERSCLITLETFKKTKNFTKINLWMNIAIYFDTNGFLDSENGGLAVKIKFLGYLEGMAPKLLYHSDK